ncbi:hypothetical protein AVEN_144632-1 [Araneus ventricosus]|uniref:Uncharacterized protein n=1 Tax=Araneus ventricosus TaxID=182803 RepID=A0A4Y2BZF7_ARAVE|nr:hypothetical protein AVEN_144632-1 [Araneus ventricosus]
MPPCSAIPHSKVNCHCRIFVNLGLHEANIVSTINPRMCGKKIRHSQKQLAKVCSCPEAGPAPGVCSLCRDTGAELVEAPIPNHKYENSRALYGCRLEHYIKESKWNNNLTSQ